MQKEGSQVRTNEAVRMGDEMGLGIAISDRGAKNVLVPKSGDD